jgi:hypothetical protein
LGRMCCRRYWGRNGLKDQLDLEDKYMATMDMWPFEYAQLVHQASNTVPVEAICNCRKFCGKLMIQKAMKLNTKKPLKKTEKYLNRKN